MSYTALPKAKLRCDVLKMDVRYSLAVNDEYYISSNRPIHTRATVNSSNKLVIYPGSHWLIEFRAGHSIFIDDPTKEYRIQMHDGTNYIGFPATMANSANIKSSFNFGRALILSSDITTSMTLSIICNYVDGTTSSGSYTQNSSSPIDSIKIMELPV